LIFKNFIRIEQLCEEEKMTYCLKNGNLLTILGSQRQKPNQNLHLSYSYYLP